MFVVDYSVVHVDGKHQENYTFTSNFTRHIVFLRVFRSFPWEVNAEFVGRFSGLRAHD